MGRFSRHSPDWSRQGWRHRRKFIILIVLAALAMGFVLTNGGPLIPPNQRARQHQATETPAGLEEVTMSAELLEQHPFIYAGINLEKIYELNLHSRTFTADGEIWLEWLPNVDKLLKANNTDPAELIHLTNRIETWDSTFEPTTKTPNPIQESQRKISSSL